MTTSTTVASRFSLIAASAAGLLWLSACGADLPPTGDAARADQAVTHDGPAQADDDGGAEGEACLADTECADGLFCRFADGCGLEADGVCTAPTGACPADPRNRPEEVCGCDGATYRFAGCATAVGVSVAHAGPCDEGGDDPGDDTLAEGDACTADGAACGDGLFCQLTDGCGATSSAGVCTATGDFCLAVHDPVCGCDGVTYDNDGCATAAGVSVAHVGACEPALPPDDVLGEGDACATTGPACADGLFCLFAQGCGFAPAPGTCTVQPELCDAVFEPVCGCDGLTYSNEACAHVAGVSVAGGGECISL